MLVSLDLDDEVLRVAQSMSVETGISLGDAVSELALRGLRFDTANIDFPVFAVSADSPPMTPSMVRQANDE